MKQFYNSFAAILLLFCVSIGFAQSGIKGTVIGSDGAPLTGVSIVLTPSNDGTITDLDGMYAINCKAGRYTITYSYVGYQNKTITVEVSNGMTVQDITMEEGDINLEDVVVVGSRSNPRSVTTSAIPIDVLNNKDLRSTGQNTFDKALQYRVPSFNTVNTPVNDATTLLDPYEIRNMGPSRTLILINGKRKNLSSLLYVQFSPGRGETGVDLSAIPQEAIERVEILRDGASAQYGSDAIAGVMNVILKSKYDYSSLNINAGMTSKSDGKTFGVSYNSGFSSDKGFLNYTVGVNQQGNAVRSGIIHLPTEIATFGDPSKSNTDPANSHIVSFLKDNPTGGNINGTAEVSALRLLLNGGINFSPKGQLYANGAVVTKKALSNANYRTPYWRLDRGLLHNSTDNGGKNYITDPVQLQQFGTDGIDLYKGYVGYMPTFEGDLLDYNGTIGVKNEVNGWNTDVSLTTGGNQQLYTVDNTVNRSLGKASPTRFKPGGFSFNHLVGNLDVSKKVSDKFNIGFGVEARNETYKIIAGDTASFSGQGSNSFPGINAINAGTNSRFNLGGYVDASYDITEDFMINATGRTEKYSDFGNANVYKLSSRYKLADDKVVIRGSYSTGFRAPTLQQIYSQSIQASFAGGTIVQSGLFNNNSVQARLLGIPKLRAEKSTNISLGLGFNLPNSLSITADYYNITVKDRIVYSSSISTDDTLTNLYKILAANDLTSVQFFVNGIETNTQGIDLVIGKRNVALGNGTFGINLAGNYVLKNEIVGAPNEPAPIAQAKSSILNEQIKSLLTEGRPKYKAILGLDYQINKLYFNLNNTLFGPTAFRDLDNGLKPMLDIKAVFTTAIVTDLSIGYAFTDKASLTLNVNNLLNVLPKWDLEASASESVSKTAEDAKASAARANAILGDPAAKALLRGALGFSGRYDILGYNGSQFSQLGTMFNVNFNLKF
jgi:iron complex outermembrane recepter protein